MPYDEQPKRLFELSTIPTASRQEIRTQIAYIESLKIGEIVVVSTTQIEAVDEDSGGTVSENDTL